MTIDEVDQVLKSLHQRLRSIGVSRVGIFGSTARNEARLDSDVDLLVEFEPGRKNLDAFMAAADILEASFTVHVDVLTPEAFDRRRIDRILKETVFHEISA